MDPSLLKQLFLEFDGSFKKLAEYLKEKEGKEYSKMEIHLMMYSCTFSPDEY